MHFSVWACKLQRVQRTPCGQRRTFSDWTYGSNQDTAFFRRDIGCVTGVWSVCRVPKSPIHFATLSNLLLHSLAALQVSPLTRCLCLPKLATLPAHLFPRLFVPDPHGVRGPSGCRLGPPANRLGPRGATAGLSTDPQLGQLTATHAFLPVREPRMALWWSV